VRTVRYRSRAFARYFAVLPRAASSSPRVERAVRSIVAAVRRDGDAALVRFASRYDGVSVDPRRIRVKAAEIRSLARRADPRVVSALRDLGGRIEAFHRRQVDRGFRVKLADGSVLEEAVRPLDSVGLYVPGGAAAYPSSVLMNAIPALVAGVSRVQVATPPKTLEANPSVAAALVVVGLEGSVYRMGGAQAIAALAYGTRQVEAVSKIVGPGNAYVAAAKRQLRGRVEVDHEAGPSEVVILADASADAGYVAADLLAQAEHGSGDETVVLVTTSIELAVLVDRLVEDGVSSVANRSAAHRALRRHGAIVLVADLDEGVDAVNAFAPEHAEVMTRGAVRISRRIVAGAVFVGPFAPVAVGDYGIGPNHVLPTGGAARFSSPLSVRDFQVRRSIVRMTRSGLARVAETVVRVAMAEGFKGHAQSVLTRFEG
jgi:histidinol dehydrogenase